MHSERRTRRRIGRKNDRRTKIMETRPRRSLRNNSTGSKAAATTVAVMGTRRAIALAPTAARAAKARAKASPRADHPQVSPSVDSREQKEEARPEARRARKAQEARAKAACAGPVAQISTIPSIVHKPPKATLGRPLVSATFGPHLERTKS